MLQSCKHKVCLEEKVSCEIRQSPSMMWKKSIVQAKAVRARASATLPLALTVFAVAWGSGLGADLVIEIPGWGASGGGGGPTDGAHYRLDYRPPHGSPAPNYTVPARPSTINFTGLPGTKYHFMLYYSNATFADLLTWNQTIITAPEPPTNLTVTLGRNKQATISWSPPAHGDYTGFRFKVIPLTERAEGGARNLTVEGAGNWTYTLRDLSPGATYQLHASTLLHDKESAAYASFNFTTKPNTPGKFIVWFRNETTLLVLWQPPYPPGAYTHYKVSIEPRDARDSELYVEKEGEPPGPAQAAFKGLVPGRAYNISVQTVSEPQLSAPTTAQYRTVPLRPRNVTLDPRSLTETSFRVTWLPPAEHSEFEKYQVSVSAVGAGGGGAGGAGAYGALLPCLVAPPLWERTANVRPLVRLLCAFVAVRPDLVIASGKLNAMLGVFQKLIASKTNDHEGFYLIQTMLFKFGESVMQQYTKQIMSLLFQRLSSSKTTKYVKGLIAFLGFYAANFGADDLVQLVDSVQANMFAMYCERVLIPDLQKVSGGLERKAAAVGCVKLLCDCAHSRQGALAPLWPRLLQALISLFELPPDDTTLPDDHFIEVDDTPGYQAQYAQLTCAKGPNSDPLAAVEDPKRYLVESLGNMARAYPGVLPPRVAALEEPHRSQLQAYLATYSVQLC